MASAGVLLERKSAVCNSVNAEFEFVLVWTEGYLTAVYCRHQRLLYYTILVIHDDSTDTGYPFP